MIGIIREHNVRRLASRPPAPAEAAHRGIHPVPHGHLRPQTASVSGAGFAGYATRTSTSAPTTIE